MTIDALPAAPDPATDTPAEFSAKAAALVAAWATFTSQTNAVAVAMNLNSTTDTSASSVAIGTGAKTFTASTGKSFQPGMYLVIADTAAPSTNSMFGQITSYDTATGALVMNILAVLGSGTKTAWVISQSSVGAVGDITGITSINGGGLAGNHNRVTNAKCLVARRPVATLTASYLYGKVDRFVAACIGGSAISGSITDAALSGTASGRAFGISAGNWTTGAASLSHRMASNSVIDMNSKTVTFSGKLYHDFGGTRTVTIGISKANVLNTFSAVTSLGTTSVSVPTGTITPFTFTLALGATDASNGLALLATDSAANTVVSKSFLGGDWQFEIGSVATTLENVDPALDRLRCAERFYSTFPAGVAPANGAGVNGSVAYTVQIAGTSAGYISPARFPVEMAGTPSTVTTYNPSGGGGGVWYSGSRASDSGVPTIYQAASTGLNILNPQVAADATGQIVSIHLTADAELY